MVKSIIKEIIIILLLLLAVILALGVLFYDYIPTNKTIPTVVEYSTSQAIQSELNEQITKEETVLVTYEITSSDLNNYKKTNTYKAGKANPFSTYVAAPTGGNTGNGTNDENDTTNTGDTKTSNDGTFYKNNGTK